MCKKYCQDALTKANSISDPVLVLAVQYHLFRLPFNGLSIHAQPQKADHSDRSALKPSGSDWQDMIAQELLILSIPHWSSFSSGLSMMALKFQQT
jgi:hypothetical protein